MNRKKRTYGADCKRRNIQINDEDYATLHQIGDGSYGEGVRRLVREYRERNSGQANHDH